MKEVFVFLLGLGFCFSLLQKPSSLPYDRQQLHLRMNDDSRNCIINPATEVRSYFKNVAQSLAAATIAFGVHSTAIQAAESNNLYSDTKNGFTIRPPSDFSILPPKKAIKEVSAGLPEETLFQSQNFAIGGTISVTRTNIQRLLEDFGIPWANSRVIKTLPDVGSANIIAQLLLLQRQGAFGNEWFRTTLKLTSASNDAAITNMDGNISEMISTKLIETDGHSSVEFTFTTPLSVGIRATSAKVLYKPATNSLFVAWISGIDSKIEATAFKDLSRAVLDSFALSA